MKVITSITTILLCAVMLLGAAACGREPEPEPTPERTFPPPPPPSTPVPTAEPIELAYYNGNVESIIFHEVIAWPEVAFSGSRRDQLDAEFATAYELRKTLEELHARNYVLINFNDIYSDSMSSTTGYIRTNQNTLEIPVGKRPVVIFFDNLNFSESLVGHGFMSKYVIGIDGDVWAEGTDPDGNYIISQDLTAITIVDKFVRENPDFSHNGAKGCLAMTGAQGILGYRTNIRENETQAERLERLREAASATAVVDRLKATGWYFASHTYSRNSLARMSLENVQRDTERWLDEVGSLVGETKILTYPMGERLDGGDQGVPGPAMLYFVDIGFRYFGAYGSNHHAVVKSDEYNITAVVFDRAYICGITLRNHGNLLRRLIDTEAVLDPARP